MDLREKGIVEMIAKVIEEGKLQYCMYEYLI